ncbi:uncharacterized protein [Epargyreus clarus]|uniref:uncharacterized protein n=1 Tax=Epargyreus clarus TaxID=520877 RepID=UPI003C2E8FDF
MEMEADDDMIVVIIGDGENDNFPEPMNIKQEVIDGDDVEKLIETAAIHGEFVELDGTNIKEEVPEDFEEDVWAGEDEEDGDEDYVPQDGESDDDLDDDADDGSGNESVNRHRHKMLKPSQQKSFVKELREQYPELEDDTNALVTTLSEIMRNVKPPPPPKDYFIMNGIMFECVICGAISETMPAAGRHYQEKHGERYLVCFACGVDFRSTTNLYKHEKRCMAPDAVIVLKARARTLGRKGRSRPYIPKHFPETSSVKKPSERKYGCSQCPAAFVSKTYLRSHEMLHRGVRPYLCSVCTSAYTSLAALSRHRKKHSDEQYICDHCGRVFKVKAALATHMDTHLPVKKFGCDRCEKRYATKAALVRHVDSYHLKLPPPCVCKICFKRYPRMSVLKEHTKKAHGLLLMTRRMFFKSLPTLTDTQLEQAKVVLKSEVEPEVPPQPPQRTYRPEPVEVYPDLDISICKEEPEEDDDQERIVLSEEVLQYMQSIQGGFDDGENYNVVVIEDGDVLNLNYGEYSADMLNLHVVQENEVPVESEMVS